eukprot:CAMPEP_0180055822 /NCGR_PEP_ID=MMETSP0985-20121206/3555_1 /TAXON_ID=483367 /ORGANISM="non described non described, Strain CCMP 2436" /LENGTH=81 /DNA_ID=CAMNT_0021985487 /DNA_START=258 /DNA_END=503 /DNA_ORIENTATION=-
MALSMRAGTSGTAAAMPTLASTTTCSTATSSSNLSYTERDTMLSSVLEVKASSAKLVKIAMYPTQSKSVIHKPMPRTTFIF